MSNWSKQEIDIRIKGLSNDALLEETISAACGGRIKFTDKLPNKPGWWAWKNDFLCMEGVAFVYGAEGEYDNQLITRHNCRFYNIEEMDDRKWSTESIDFSDKPSENVSRKTFEAVYQLLEKYMFTPMPMKWAKDELAELRTQAEKEMNS